MEVETNARVAYCHSSSVNEHCPRSWQQMAPDQETHTLLCKAIAHWGFAYAVPPADSSPTFLQGFGSSPTVT